MNYILKTSMFPFLSFCLCEFSSLPPLFFVFIYLRQLIKLISNHWNIYQVRWGNYPYVENYCKRHGLELKLHNQRMGFNNDCNAVPIYHHNFFLWKYISEERKLLDLNANGIDHETDKQQATKCLFNFRPPTTFRTILALCFTLAKILPAHLTIEMKE